MNRGMISSSKIQLITLRLVGGGQFILQLPSELELQVAKHCHPKRIFHLNKK